MYISQAVEEQYPNEVENSINTPIPVSLAVNRIQFHYEARNLTVTLKSGSDEVCKTVILSLLCKSTAFVVFETHRY